MSIALFDSRVDCHSSLRGDNTLYPELVNGSVVTIHRCIDVSRYLSRDMYRDTVCNNRDTCDLATFLRFLLECLTDINCQSAKNYQCRMSSHPQQTASSYSQLNSIKLCCMSVISNIIWSYDLSVVTGSSSLDTSRRRVSTLTIVFFACDFRRPGTNLIGP